MATVCHAEDRWALLVGIDQYANKEITPLRGAVNDVKALQKVLVEHAGFSSEKVFCLVSDDEANLPSQGNIVIKLNYIASEMKPGDAFVFFFSGHGISRDGKSYLLPYEADMRTPFLLAKTGLSTEEVLMDCLGKIQSGKIVLILDACRNNPQSGKGDAENVMTDEFVKGMRLRSTQPGVDDDIELRATIFACKRGERAYEYPGKNRGFFSVALEEALKGRADDGDGRITLNEVESYLSKRVPALMRQELGGSSMQTPWVDRQGAGVGDWAFSFVGDIVDKGPEVYRLEIDYTEGFQVSLNGKPTGKQTPTSFVLSAGQYTLSLTKQGYKPYKTTVDLGPENPMATVRGTGILDDQPVETGYGLLYVKASVDGQPAQATVFVDGKEVGSTDYTDPVIPSGPHKVKVSMQSYHDHEELVTVGIDSKHTVDAVLRPAYGSLEVSSTPSEADVELMDLSNTRWGSGRTAYKVEKLPSGDYTLKLSKERYYDKIVPITISDGQTAVESVKLDPRFGTLVVNSTPSGATVYLAGNELGKTPLEEGVDSGSYILEIRKELHVDWSGQVNIRDGERKNISQNLAASYGELNVEVTPEGARILVDGKDMGRTSSNVTMLKLEPGTYHIEIKHDDYVPQSHESLLIVRGGTEILSAPLERKLGKLRVLSTPQEALISVDGKAYGMTPNIISLPTGSHRLKLSKESPYQDHEEIVDIVWNKTVERNVELSTAPEGMVLIPAGEFQMGSNDGDDDEKPVHTVYVDAFYMDKYEVTNAQYRKFIDATGYRAPRYWSGSRYNAPDQPVVGVSWHDAAAYAKWSGKRLPTEAEWEKAARGGLPGKKYPWGDSIGHDDANYSGTGGKDHWSGTSPVGSFSANGYGLYDMAGNVWEWCSDWYDSSYYANSPSRNPVGPGSGQSRVLRGGSWDANGVNLRYALRGGNNPTSTSSDSGFRCCASRSD